MPLILTSRTPWRRRPSGLVAIDRSSPLANGLVAAWPLGGTLRDVVSGGVLVATGAPGYTGSELGGLAAVLDGASQYFTTTSLPVSDTPFSVGMWHRPDAATGGRTLWCLSDTAVTASYHRTEYDETAGAIAAESRGGGGAAESSLAGAVTDGLWHHAVSVYGSATNRQIFSNGVAGTANTTSTTPTGLDTFGIGALVRTTIAQVYDGALSDVCVWSRALTDTEIQALYDPSTRWSLYQPLVRRTYFDLGGGATTLDSGLLSLLVTAPAVTVLTASAVSAGTQTATVTAPTTAAVPGAVTADAGSATATATAPAADATAGAATVGAGQTTATTTAPTADTAAGAITIAAGAQTATVTAPDPSVVLTGGGLLDAGIVAVTVTAPSAAAAAGAITVAASAQTVTISAPMPAVVATITRDAGTITVTITAPTGVLAPGAVLLTAGMASVVVTAGGAVLVVAGGVVPEASGRYTWTIGVRDDTWSVPARDDTWRIPARDDTWEV